ncbi:hypothetical protein [Amycolatopsis kentuckyensis]|uniref:hypothetical protein n=1 Tax=Amycolatopsis kentuckyensis TaxID=218823 RepID=UPI0035662E18
MESTVPYGLAEGGRALWQSLLTQDASLSDELNPARQMAVEACRTKDRLDLLDDICRTEPVMLDNGKGQPVAHPAWVEARQQGNALKQLIVALRLPDKATGKRPQVQRGSSPTRGAGVVSSLERARAAKSGT